MLKGLVGQPIDTGEVADRMVELALGAPAGRVPDVGGPEVRLIGDAVRTYLSARMRSFWNSRCRARRGGALTCPENRYGRILWEEFLRKETVETPDLAVDRSAYDRFRHVPGVVRDGKEEGVTARGLVLMDVLGLRRVMSNPSDQEHRGRSRPTGALRLAFRLPIYLYRLGLGQLLGHRFMLLTHRGRRSGRVYQTALEGVRYDPSLRETVVASGWGERSDWYRNLKAHPALEIRTGRERYAPEQRFLTPEEVYREIVDYERLHPWAVRIVPLCWASGWTAPTRASGLRQFRADGGLPTSAGTIEPWAFYGGESVAAAAGRS